jgi:hypothetical protein
MEQNNGTNDIQTSSGKLPDTVAFQDEFTREFMDSTEEVEDGYYLFRSQTDGYTMLFPKNGKLSQKANEVQGDFFETISFGNKSEEGHISFFHKITFEDKPTTKNIDINLEILSSSVGYNGDYEHFENEKNSYYFATDTYESDKKEYYRYFGYIKSKNNDKGIEFLIDSTCSNVDIKCNLGSNEQVEYALKLMKSVEFTDLVTEKITPAKR